ncbi:MAG: hypothetical protein QOK43_2353 [Acidimicrobiaceae bacterium]|nr:hypothetical protein [Acidimicrobiaceae bacterium]
MNKDQWRPRHVIAVAGLLCAAVIAAPVAVGAATGQLVNIADGTTSTQIAKVDRFGQLKVDSSQLRPIAATAGLNSGKYNMVLQPNSATVAVTDLSLAIYQSDTAVWGYDLYQLTATTGAECANGGTGSYRYLGHYTVQGATSLAQSFSTPIVLKPLSGSAPWCLAIFAANQPSSTTYFSYANLLGYVVSGTYPPAAPAAASASSVQSGKPNAAVQQQAQP